LDVSLFVGLLPCESHSCSRDHKTTIEPLGAQPVKVGTFNKPAIAVAYYRSQLWNATLKEKRDEMAAAKAANDTAKIEH
jgi:hypothetical protein